MMGTMGKAPAPEMGSSGVNIPIDQAKQLERTTGFEPATLTLAR